MDIGTKDERLNINRLDSVYIVISETNTNDFIYGEYSLDDSDFNQAIASK